MMASKNTYSFLFVVLIIMYSLTACGGAAGTRVGNPPTTTSTQVFPANFAVVSPLEYTTANADLTESFLLFQTLPTIYNSYITEIDNILNGTTINDCYSFNLAVLMTSTHAGASCYGPAVPYIHHPDGDNSSGTFPGGDLGIWTENEEDTNEACSAAELNALMFDFTSKNQEVLKIMASMVCVMNIANLELPDSGELDLSTAMQDMLSENNVTDAAVTSASLGVSEDAATEKTIYSYSISLTFTDDVQENNIILALQHMPLDSENTTYIGKYNFRWDNSPLSLCTENTTEAGSVLYNQSVDNILRFKTDTAFFCTEDATPFDSNDLLDTTDSYDAIDNPTGWVANWSSFQADFNTLTREGIYSFAWQAGNFDPNTRAINLALSENDSALTGTSYFGFGPDVISNQYGSIGGFICNWTGPGNNKTLNNYVQQQLIEENASGIFEATASFLAYSPQNACAYLETDPHFGTFEFDSDGDGEIDTDPDTVINNELLVVHDLDDNGFFDELEADDLIFPLTLIDID